MASDTEDDFPLNGGSDKLSKLFEENALDDISFRFSIPKHPSATKLQTPAPNTVPLNVIFGKTVEAFQMKIEGYKSEGKVGIAIIGNDQFNYYQLYMYRSDERKVASVEISFKFSFLVQEHNYASFKDSLGIQWSIHFDKSSELISFSKEIALARWRSTPLCQCKLIQEAFKGKTESIVNKFDSVKVNYTVHTLSPENSFQEEVSKKVIFAPANSPNWEISLIGSYLKSKKFVIIPSKQCESQVDLLLPHGFHMMLELEIDEITPFSKSNDQSSCSLGIQNASKRSIEKKEESSHSLSERMSRIGFHLPDLHPAETESNCDLSDKIKPVPSKIVTPVSSTSIISKEDGNYPSGSSDIQITSQFNILFSEVRTNNSEIRMNINRVNDKIDTLISKIESNPEVNRKETPLFEKIENMNEVLHRLLEQNLTMASLLEKNSLSNYESTLNEVIQLRKRNSELESLLDVAGSTSQILKEKIDELNWKLSALEKINRREEIGLCSHCSGAGDRVVKELEENVKNLQEKNVKLLRATEELEHQNEELRKRSLSTVQSEDNQALSLQLCLLEKDKRIEDLERDIGRLNSEIKKKLNRQAVEREITEVAKTLMNKAYKTLKNTSRDSTLIDHSFADALREMTKDYLESHFERKSSPSLCEQEKPCRVLEEPSQESYEHLGKLPSSPNKFPVPKPRRQMSRSKTVSNQSSMEEKNSLTSSIETQLTDNNGATESNKTDILGHLSTTNTPVKPNNTTKDRSYVNTINSLFNTEESKNNNINAINHLSNNAEISHNQEDSLNRERLSNDSNSDKTEPHPSPLQTSYSSTFYPPLISTTPPPLSDDISD